MSTRNTPAGRAAAEHGRPAGDTRQVGPAARVAGHVTALWTRAHRAAAPPADDPPGTATRFYHGDAERRAQSQFTCNGQLPMTGIRGMLNRGDT
jgi:hypothetical protein